VSEHVRRGLSDLDRQGRATRRYRYCDEAPTDAPHVDDNGVNAALDVLVRNGLVSPLARMRPLAVLH
jgi:tRNA-splicing ligase RtcB